MKIKTPLPRFPHGWLFGLVFAVTLHFPAIAQRSGVGSSSVSLPTGPGSIEGLGESYQPALNTGTGKYSIPLKGTPGIGGMMPSLELAYDCGGGNGVLGVGWAFGPGAIQRRSDKGIPRYIDGPNGIDDDFDGVIDNPEEVDIIIDPSGEDLTPVPDFVLPNVTNYFAKVTGAFIRYRRTNDYWEGVTPTGTRMVYGQSPSARVVDPAVPNHVFQWLLEKEIDTHGNTIEYHYGAFTNDANRGQKYLLEARWGPGPGPWTNFHFASFTYEDRADWFEDCRSGFVVRTGKRLAQIDMGTQGPTLVGHAQGDLNHDGIVDNLNRRYRLAHDPQAFRTALTSVTLIGADGLTPFPSTTFQYTAVNTNTAVSAISATLTSLNEPISTFEDPGVDLIDLNGDGLPDLLRTLTGGSGQYCSLNQGMQASHPGAIVWGDQQELLPGADGLAWKLDLSDSSTHLADMNGDGLVDLVHVGFDSVEYYPNSPTFSPSLPGWGNQSPMAIQDYPPPAPFDDPDTQTADINFDKRLDIIKSISVGNGVSYQIWYNLSHLAQPTYSLRQTVTPSTGYLFSGPGVQIVDFNGDRVPDILQIRPTGVKVTAGLGYGTFTDEIMVSLPNAEFLSDDQVAHAHFQDINGDGLADLVIDRAEPGVLWFWLNQGNYTFDSKRFITDLPAPVGNVSTRWADMNGNGTTDLVWADTSTTPHLTIIDIGQLMGAVPRAGMLTQVNNGLGGITQWRYASTVDFMLADGADSLGNYTYPWAYPLPFPVNVVSNQVVSDSLGNTIETDFAYHDGYYDGVEQEFRGFGRAEEIQVGDATSPTLVTRHFFDVGAAEIAMKGNLLGQSVEQADGSVFSTVTNRWQTVPFAVGLNGVVSRWAAMTNATETVIELGSGPAKQIQTDYAYDWVGNQTLVSEWGVVENGNLFAGNDERFTATTFAYNSNQWLVRFPVRTTLSDASGNLITQTDHFYDDASFSGNNSGMVTVGDPTLTRQWYNAANPTGFVRAQRTRYDTYGNPIASWDPLGDPAHPENGHFGEVAYEPDFHQFPVQTTQHIGGGHSDLIIRAAYDHGFGIVTSSTDANGHQTAYGYDPFERLVSVVRPGDTGAFPTMAYAYGMAIPVGATGLVNYVESRHLDKSLGSAGENPRDYYLISRKFVDGLGRTLMTKSEGGTDSNGGPLHVLVSGAEHFNVRGLPARTLNPFYSNLTGSSLDDLLAFESIEDPGWTGQFEDNGALVSLGLADAHQAAMFYDAQMRTVAVVNPDGTTNRMVYEPLVTRSFDENQSDLNSPHYNTPMVHHSDGLGRLRQIDESARLNDDGTPNSAVQTWTTRYTYDVNDKLTSVTDSQNNTRSMQYDGLGRRTFLNDCDRGVLRTIYDAASNVIQTQDAKEQVITYTYDGVNRMLTEDYHDEGKPFSHNLIFDPAQQISATNRPDVAYFYDQTVAGLDLGNGSTGTAANTLGRLAYVWDLSGEQHTSYDARGRTAYVVKRVLDPIHGQLASFLTSMSYDSADRVTSLTYPDNDAIGYQYNDRGIVLRITGNSSGSILSNLVYWPSGQEAQIYYGNGVQTRYAHDNRLRLSSLVTAPQTAPGSPLIAFSYSFDGASNIKGISDQRPRTVVPTGDLRRNSQSYQYDDLYRIVGAHYSFAAPGMPASNNGQLNYCYDRIGNMLSQTSTLSDTDPRNGLPLSNLGQMDSGGSAGRSNRTGRQHGDPPGPHALTSISNPSTSSRNYFYDANGNMTNLDGLVMTWDFLDRLVAMDDAAMHAEYIYDFTGRRITKRVTAKPGTTNLTSFTTTYVGKFFEVREFDAPTKYVFNGDVRVACVTGSLSTNTRIQRFRVATGWNLLSLAVTASNAATQLSAGGIVQGLYEWNTNSVAWVVVDPNQTIPAGTVLWLNATTNSTLSVSGDYQGPQPNTRVPPGGAFLSGYGLEVLPLTNQPSSLELDVFATDSQVWQIQLPFPLGRLLGFPTALAPGTAIFASAAASTDLVPPDASLSLRYYHQDHLGSSSCITDANGDLIEEEAFYPFGSPRNRYQPRSISDAYQFTQKEQDVESGLDYFEARYLTCGLGRFLTVDPLEHNYSIQELGGYSYVGNRPTWFVDSTGKNRIQLRSRGGNIQHAFLVKTDDDGNTLNILSYGVRGPANAKTYTHGDEDKQTAKIDFQINPADVDKIWTAMESSFKDRRNAGGFYNPFHKNCIDIAAICIRKGLTGEIHEAERDRLLSELDKLNPVKFYLLGRRKQIDITEELPQRSIFQLFRRRFGVANSMLTKWWNVPQDYSTNAK